MKYEYDITMEAFRREDKRGKPLYVNITEANRIVNLINLGYTVASITGKISLSNPKGTVTTLNSFIRNYKQGNIVMPDDAPAPTLYYESMDDNDRLDELEKRISELEEKINKPQNRVMKWLNR